MHTPDCYIKRKLKKKILEAIFDTCLYQPLLSCPSILIFSTCTYQKCHSVGKKAVNPKSTQPIIPITEYLYNYLTVQLYGAYIRSTVQERAILPVNRPEKVTKYPLKPSATFQY